MYDLPKGKVGKWFLYIVSKILDGIQARQWNSERFMVYWMVVLQLGGTTIKTSKAIRNRFTWCLNAWDRDEFAMLVQTTAQDMQTKLCRRQDGQMPERRGSIFQSKMLKGDLRRAEKVGVLFPDDIDEKYEVTIKAVLQSKRPEAAKPHKSTIYQYELTPDFVNVDIAQDTVDQVACNLSGSAGLGGVGLTGSVPLDVGVQ
jgi:hypothetical protein